MLNNYTISLMLTIKLMKKIVIIQKILVLATKKYPIKLKSKLLKYFQIIVLCVFLIKKVVMMKIFGKISNVWRPKSQKRQLIINNKKKKLLLRLLFHSFQLIAKFFYIKIIQLTIS
jgi:hypothetical protein